MSGREAGVAERATGVVTVRRTTVDRPAGRWSSWTTLDSTERADRRLRVTSSSLTSAQISPLARGLVALGLWSRLALNVLSASLWPEAVAMRVLNLVRRHPVVTYVLLACGLSWAYWIPMALRGETVTAGGGVTHFPGLFGPLVAAAVVTVIARGSAGLA